MKNRKFLCVLICIAAVAALVLSSLCARRGGNGGWNRKR